MKLTPLSPHAHQLTRYGCMNCYLVREADGFTLIDTTMSGAAKHILGAAQQLGAPIRRILLTHAHVDHVGSVDELAAALPGATLAASDRSVPLLQQTPDKRTLPGEPADPIKGGLPGIATPVSHFIQEGEHFGSLLCVHTPGHIPGHFAFVDERDGTLYAGDELVAVGKLVLSGYAPWYFPLPNFATWNRALVVQSAKKLLELPIQRFACGHGAVRSGGAPAIEALIAQAA